MADPELAPPSDPLGTRTARRLLRVVLALAVLGFFMASLLIWSARWFWVGEVAVALSWYVGIAGLAGVLVLVAAGWRRAALIAAVVACLHLAPEAHTYLGAGCDHEGALVTAQVGGPGRGGEDVRVADRDFTVVTLNRRAGAPNEDLVPLTLLDLAAELGDFEGPAASSNADWRAELAALRTLLADDRTAGFAALGALAPGDLPTFDVVCFQECNRAFLASFDALKSLYPYQVFSPARATWNDGTFGTAIVSRWPITSNQMFTPPPGFVRGPHEAVVDWNGTAVTVRNAHPMRPGKAWRIAARDDVFDTLAVEDWSGPALLCGDLNMTSASPAFGDLLKATGLVDTRRGFGRQATWMLDERFGIGVPIDHVLATPDWCVLDRRTFDVPKSDHDGVFVRLALHGAEGEL